MSENTETELVNMALSVSAAGGAVADAVKKAVFHAHGVDWAQILTLAEVLRVNAATLALLAEREIEEQQQGLFNVTLEPMLFGDYLPGDVGDGVAP